MKAVRILVLVALPTLCGAVPQQINYQGTLTRTNGSALDTTVSMTFKLYSDSTAGSLLWTETRPAVAVAGGLFQVRLGQLAALSDAVLNQAQLWLGITVGGNSEMTPRVRMVSAGYSYRTGTVDGANGGTITGDVTVVGKGNIGVDNSNEGVSAFVAGSNNHARGWYSVVAGGGGAAADSNSAYGIWATVSGGRRNIVAGGFGTVAGGMLNTASGDNSTVSGGAQNVATGNQGTVSGGSNNTASNAWTTVSGGGYNTASSAGAMVCGGGHNLASSTDAAVCGGESNSATGAYSIVCGGYNNRAAGPDAAVVGGEANTAMGTYSFACGYRARANHASAFVWGGSNMAADSTASYDDFTFTARCPNGARFYTAHTGTWTGVQLPAGGGAWSNLCDVRRKNLHGAVNTSEVLRKLSELPLHRWSYKSQNDAIEHIGPTAQDFHAAFHLGESDTTISTLDPDGVALAAIQELAKQNRSLQQEVAELHRLLETTLAQNQHSFNSTRKEESGK